MSRIFAGLVLVVALGGCVSIKWNVPATPEGNACKRECMGLYNQCLQTPFGGPYPCGNERNECLATCPGATPKK